MKKIMYAATVGLGIFLGIQAVQIVRPTPATPQTLSANTTRVVESTQTPTIPSEKPLYKPVTLRIPKLDVETTIEEVQEDSSGAMDVPKDDNNVGWYSLGVMPGAQGNAVVAGHFDTKTGEPAVFYNLSTLEVGDEIIVVDEKNNLLTFIVEKKETYSTDAFPLQKVFGESSGKMLNLITCEGTFNQARKLYSERLVIFSRLKE